MNRKPLIFWILLWLIGFSGKLPETASPERSAQEQPTANPDLRPGIVAAQPEILLQDSVAEQLLAETDSAASDIDQIHAGHRNAPGTQPRKQRRPKTGWVLFSSVLLSLGSLRMLGAARNRRKRGRTRRRKPRGIFIGSELAVVLAVIIGVLIGFLGLVLTSVWLGLPASAFGMLSLALLCSIGVAAVVGLIVFAIIALTSEGRGARGLKGLGYGCAMAFLGIFIVIPGVLFLAALMTSFFLSLFLGISVGLWLALGCWLTLAAFLVGGYALAWVLRYALESHPDERKKKDSEEH